jgi:acyl transferase domain-containing protein/SAM-dependent methyltransferase
MTVPVDEALSPVKRALLEIRELKAQLARSNAALHEPIAIVGMALRLPGGVVDAAGLADLLWSGTDAIGAIPPERWNLDALYDADADAPGKMTTRFGGFVDGVDRFDAEFFGISPREAASMDPQQRLLLEVAWEALEDAGHAPAELAATPAGERTGVYLGISNNDYGRALYRHPELIDPYFATGNAASVASGRLSYFLGVHGPAVAVDTACSSSLVALHLACQGLRLRECEIALAGAVNLILTPEMNINFSKARMMAPDGRCKTFDAAADGYVRGEGCAVLVLKRLADAQAAGDRVLAVVRGSALNQDGRSGGLTAPNGPAQEAVIRAALASAQVEARQIGYVEAHGTGTPLGDPIEFGALSAVLGRGRAAAQPLRVGSVKTNIGHLEAAAGLAGVAKVVLSLQRAQIPPHLHFMQGNPHIDWNWPVQVPTKTTDWPEIDGRRLAGVSSFGFSGTNAHVILEAAPAPSLAAPPAGPLRPAHVLALSARDDAALLDLARRHEARLLQLDDSIEAADLCFSAATGRSHFSHRVALVGSSLDELRAGLAGFLAGSDDPAIARGQVEGAARPQVAFLFTGQGGQYAAMGRDLYDSAPVFRAAMDACDAAARPRLAHLQRSLLDVVFTPAGSGSPINETVWAQPVNFAIEVSLAALWRSWGIEPVALLGHSLGEYAAACVSGLLSLEDGMKLVIARGRLTHELPADGAMAAVFAAEAVVQAELAHGPTALTIAAYNGPEHFVISGPRHAVDAATQRLEAAGVRVKLLRVPHAAHSSLIEPVLPAYRSVLETVSFHEPRIALVSNVSGAPAGAAEVGRVDYWLTHMRQPVRFAQALQGLLAQGITHFIEVGPHPVLLGMGAECAGAEAGAAVEWLPSLHRERADWSDLLASLQRLYVAGADVNWAAFDAPYRRSRVALPTYPFRARRHWMDVVGDSPAPGVDAAQRWARVSTALSRQAERGPLDLNAASYPAKWDCLARVTSAHAAHTLREAGLFLQAGESHTLDGLMQRSGIGASYRHLVSRWLDSLVDGGVLRRAGEAFVADQALAEPPLAALWAEAERLFTDNAPLLAYVRHCGGLVAPVLLGRESPLETLFPGGSFELAENLYERSATMRYINGLAAAAFETLAASVPAGRALRVLEVGAGTGGTSSAVLAALPADRAHYQFTDVSDVFLDRARERFAAYPFVRFGRFDMDADPQAQGYAPGSVDAIVSANAVHASKDLRVALKRLRELLAPGGMLVLVESTTHLPWFDMTTGLIEGWQHFADDLRGDNPLLPPARWIEALREAGFDEAGAWPPAGSPAEALGQHVIVARVPGEAVGAMVSDAAADAAPQRAAAAAPAELAQAFRQRLLDAMAGERTELMRDFVRERVVRVLRLDAADAPGRADRLMDIGFDSLMAVQLRNQLGSGLGLDKPLPATLMFDHPTIDALALHLLDRVMPKTAPPATGRPAPAVVAQDASVGAVAAMSDAQIEALLMSRLEGS